MLTFEQFQATGTDIENLFDLTGDEMDEGPGRAYDLSMLYLGKDDDGNWYVFIEGNFISTPVLEEAERYLYTHGYLPLIAE